MLSHVDVRNRPSMVDVGAKAVTDRSAHAVAVVSLPAELARQLQGGDLATAKGPVFATAIVAGVMGAKKTSELIPLCHPLPLEDCQIEIELSPDGRDATVHCRVRTHAKTGVEMEALTGVSVAALTIYDMVKAISPGMVIKEISLREKTGGKADYQAP
jgi:cyclic pyranopterin monophosphate synthase